jgi:hypothetical protein
MAISHQRELPSQVVVKAVGQDSNPVLRALTISDEEDAALELDILEPQAQRLQQPQAASVKQAGDEVVLAIELAKHATGFLFGENNWYSFWPPGAYHSAEPWQVHLQHVFVEK